MTYLILGCGWIGEALAIQLLQEGHYVYATTTGSEKYQRLISAGIFAIQVDFDIHIAVDDFPKEIDFVLTSVPAVKRLAKDQLRKRFEQVARILSASAYKKHIFLSSVGVYPDHDGVFTEEYPLFDHLENNLLIAESKMLMLNCTTVFRLGGLFGATRIFAKYFEDKVCTTGGQLANFIHREDVIALIKQSFVMTLRSAIYNIVTPEHPTKKEIILASATKYDYKMPASFEDKDSFQKFVCGSKIQQELGYQFIYPSPLVF